MVYYLKYRPQTISDLDNERVRSSLYSVLANPDSIPHAFLFTGPKGLGKTSSARILAKAVNCTGRSSVKTEHSADTSIEPCNSCDSCLSITNGSNVDVIEIDAASNRGIDEMRDLKEKIRFSPVSAKKKIYIIDEVHMLTTEAFNALLKTLEEPPKHAMFILCTTEPHKIPSTILSRCFHVAFSKATNEELVRSFTRIVAGEHVKIRDDVLTAVAKISDGGFRDGAKMLEELVSLSRGEPITLQTLENIYKTTSIDQAIVVLVDSLRNMDAVSAIKLITKLSSEGVDMKYFVEQIIEAVHQTLLMRIGIESAESMLPNDIQKEELQNFLIVFMKVASDMRYGVVPELPLELAVLDWTLSKARKETKRIEEKSEEGTSAVQSEMQNTEIVEEVTVTKTTTTVLPVENTVASMRKQVGNILKVKALYGEPKEEKVEIKLNKLSLDAYNNDGPLSKEWIQEFWRCLIEQMKVHNHTIAGVLRGCDIQNFDKETLIIETAYKFHQDKLADTKIKMLLEATCKELVGKKIAVSIVLKQ